MINEYFTVVRMHYNVASEHLPIAELFIMHIVESAFLWFGCVSQRKV